MRFATSFVLAALALSATAVPTMMKPRGAISTTGDKGLDQQRGSDIVSPELSLPL